MSRRRRLKLARRFREAFSRSITYGRSDLDSAGDSTAAVYRFADLVLDPGRRSVQRGTESLALPRKSFDMLLALVEAAPDALSSDELMDRVWQGAVVSQATVAKRVELLRQALDDDSQSPRYVALVRGHGYRLVPDVQQSAREPAPRSRWPTAAALSAIVAVALVVSWIASRPGPPPERSVAVLPFDVIADDADVQLFAEGLADELRHVLSSRNRLRVIGRTSSIYFRDRDDDLKAIGESLGVAHVLEGSVRRSGNRLRVSAQLSSTADGFTLWSESYDREASGVIAIQEDIALNVAAQLQVAFGDSGSPPAPDSAVISPEAYALYLRAVSLSPYGKLRDLGEAQRLIEEVTRLAPDFAPGWNRLAAVYGRRLLGADPGFGKTPEEALAIAADAVNKALTIDPESAEAYANLGGGAWVFERNAEKAAPLIQRALTLNAGNLDIVAFAAEFAKYIGRFEESLRLEEIIIGRDPLCNECRYRLAQSYLYAGRYADANREYQTLRTLAGGGYNWSIGLAQLMMEKPAEALALFEAVPDDQALHLKLAGRAAALCDLGRREDALQALEELVERAGAGAPQVTARAYAHCGDSDTAFEWLERSLPDNTVALQVDFPNPLYDRLRDDPRWQDLMRRIGRSKEQTDAIKFSLDAAMLGLPGDGA